MRQFSSVASHLLDVFIPRTCWLTGGPLSDNGIALATPIQEALATQLQARYCHRCGADRLPGTASCPFCPHRHLGTAEIVRAGGYSYPLKELIGHLKFQRHWGLAPLLAAQMAEAWQRAGRPQMDVLVPVPLHWRREFGRGFNQSRELARFLSRHTGVTFYDGLVRLKAAGRQATAISAHQRRENLRGAFASKPMDWAGMSVWLVDDVCTTGSTLHAAAAAFAQLPLAHRPARISAIVLAVTGANTAPAKAPH